MNNPKLYQALSVLGFIVSAIFTIKLFCSNSTDLVSWFAMVTMAILYEFGKYTLLYQGLKGKFQMIGKTVLLSAWLFVTSASIMASATYVLNDANANKNIQIQDSAAYAQQQNGIKIQNDLYSTTKKQIDDLKALQEQQKVEGERIVNNMPKNYTDRRNQQRVETQALISKTQQEINKKSEQLLSIAAGISSPTKIEIETQSTTGGESMFKLIAQKLNENQKKNAIPYSTEQVSLFFYIAIGIGLELLANLFAFLSQYYKYGGIKEESSTPPPSKKSIPEPVKHEEKKNERVIQGGRLKGMTFKVKPKIKNNITEFKPKIVKNKNGSQNIGLENNPIKQPENNLTNEMKNYLKIAQNNLKENGDLPSRQDMSNLTGYSPEKCRTLHNKLKEFGILQTELKPRRTYIVSKQVVV